MTQLLNRLAWFLCMALGLGISSIFDNSEGFFIFGIIGGILLKYFFFPENYIKSRLEFFSSQIEKKVLSNFDKNVVGEKSESLENSSLSQNTPGENIPLSPIVQNEISIPEVPLQQENHFSVLQETAQEENKNVAYSSSKQENTSKYQYNIGEMIQKFFSENLLAKVGGILVFLGVFFFLTLIYAIVGPVTKLIIGFLIGFSTYAAGVWLEKKGYTQESKIVLGTAILINYLVILSGRYLLGGNNGNGNLLPVTITFLFLILNTIFGVVTALVYQSHTLLVLSFVFAYLNPLLLGAKSQEPYTLLGYTSIVTLGAMFMSYQRKDVLLFVLSYIFSALLFLGAPYHDSTGWITKLLCINALGVIGLYVSTVFSNRYKYMSEILIGGSFLLMGLIAGIEIRELHQIQLAILGFSSLGFMLFSYSNMKKGAFLYSIGTIGTIFVLSPSLLISGTNNENIFISLSLISLFLTANVGTVLFRNKTLISENLGNILGGLISGAIFMTYIIYVFGLKYFPGMIQGFTYFLLAGIYALSGFFIVSKIGIEEMKQNEKYRNIFYVLSGIAISFFSLSIAFIFAEKKEIISLIWILESNILFYFSYKTRSQKIALGGLVLFIIAIIKMISFLDLQVEKNYGLLIVSFLMYASLIWNLFMVMRCTQKGEQEYLPVEFIGIHHIFHVMGILLSSKFIFSILHISTVWNILLGAVIIISILGYIYRLSESKGLQKLHIGVYVWALCSHIVIFSDNIGNPELPIAVSTALVGIFMIPFIGEYIYSKAIKNNLLLLSYLVYIFIISTLYIFHFTHSTYAVTLYWGVLSFGILGYGIQKDIIQFRTIGLYILTLTGGKIFFNDVGEATNNPLVRVLALMIIGILMIILQTMYTKKYGKALKKDFNPENLFPKKENKSEKVDAINFTKNESEKNEEKQNTIQRDIENIKLDESLIGVRMYIHGTEKAIQVRAVNLIKIAKLIEDTLHKTEFHPGELSEMYALVTKNYKSSLSPEQYKKIETIVAEFVKHGGKIEFVRK